LLTLAFVPVVAGCALLRGRTTVAYGLVVAGTIVSAVAWRQDEIPPMQFLGVDVALRHVAATRSRRCSLGAAAEALGVFAGYLVLRLVAGDGSGTSSEPYGP
jgi:hypothetical protein